MTTTSPPTTVAVQLPSERHPLNPQQVAIAQAVVVDGDDVAVRAKAGTGKTLVLEAVARRLGDAAVQGDPRRRILYIAYNASVQKEAAQRMPRNVEPRTGHSLAWQWAGIEFTAKVKFSPDVTRLGLHAEREAKFLRSRASAVAKALGVGAPMGPDGKIYAARQAEIIMAVVGHYANSADDRIGQQHFRTPDGANLAARLSPRERDAILMLARRYWDDISTPLGSGRCLFKATFDHLRKMWALARPDLSAGGFGAEAADVLFLDEAQDTPPVLARVVAEQRGRMQLAVVGDPDQAIYAFTGATDALDHFDIAKRLPLTTSYRFGPGIQDIANRYLAVLSSPDRVVGHATTDHVGPVTSPDAVLTRTNMAMLHEIVTEQDAGRTIGVLTSTKTDLANLCATARWMKDGGKAPDNPHETLARFPTWDVFKEAAPDHASVQVRTAYDMLKMRGIGGLAAVVDRLIGVEDTSVATRNRAIDCLFVTAHKAKGLEWDTVRIGNDFKQPKHDKHGNLILPEPEELRLAYVAVTRARQRLDPGSLEWVFEYTDSNGTEVYLE